MHNLISFNQLAGSKHTFDPQNDKIADYYECIVECEEDQHICKRMCKGGTTLNVGFNTSP